MQRIRFRSTTPWVAIEFLFAAAILSTLIVYALGIGGE